MTQPGSAEAEAEADAGRAAVATGNPGGRRDGRVASRGAPPGADCPIGSELSMTLGREAAQRAAASVMIA